MNNSAAAATARETDRPAAGTQSRLNATIHAHRYSQAARYAAWRNWEGRARTLARQAAGFDHAR
jgi:hypothetical protein